MYMIKIYRKSRPSQEIECHTITTIFNCILIVIVLSSIALRHKFYHIQIYFYAIATVVTNHYSTSYMIII